MVEVYGTNKKGSQKTSTHSIQEMKKNMQKVPIIQKKSQAYHSKDQKHADMLLEKVTTAPKIVKQSTNGDSKSNKNHRQSLREKFISLWK